MCRWRPVVEDMTEVAAAAAAMRFGAVLAHDLVLLRREQLAPFGVRACDCELFRHDKRSAIAGYLIASGLVGEPTAPVIGIAGATNMNSYTCLLYTSDAADE